MQVVLWSAQHERLGLSYLHKFRFHVFTAVSDHRLIFRSAKEPNIMSGRFDSDSLARPCNAAMRIDRAVHRA
jgi:hypothetical protein